MTRHRRHVLCCERYCEYVVVSVSLVITEYAEGVRPRVPPPHLLHRPLPHRPSVRHARPLHLGNAEDRGCARDQLRYFALFHLLPRLSPQPPFAPLPPAPTAPGSRRRITNHADVLPSTCYASYGQWAPPFLTPRRPPTPTPDVCVTTCLPQGCLSSRVGHLSLGPVARSPGLSHTPRCS